MDNSIYRERIPTPHFINPQKPVDETSLPPEMREGYRGDGSPEYNPTPPKQYHHPEDGPIVMTLRQLECTAPVHEPTLLDPFFPHCGLVALVGKADCGKSMLARQLAISVAANRASFLGFPLRPKHHSAIYLSTEDGSSSTRNVIDKQKSVLPDAERELAEDNLRFLFQNSHSPEALRRTIDEALRKQPADLVVIDGYADMFEGKDANSMTDVRQMLRTWYDMAQAHSCVILFISHLTKAGSDLAPNQNFVIGSGAFTQKMRTVLDLRREKDSFLRKLVVLKGNGISDEEKSKAPILEFDPDTLTFENTGRTTNPSQPVQQPTTELDFAAIFGESEELPASEILKAVKEKYGLGETRARHYMKRQLTPSNPGYWRLPPKQEELDALDGVPF